MSLLNKSETRKFIMEKAKILRPGWTCTQIAESALITIEAKLHNMIENMVKSHPTKGKTFKEII